MGLPGRHPLHGRRLHRPPGVRGGRHRPSARSRGLPGGHRAAAQLARRPARLHQVGSAASLLRGVGRGDGLDGQPLHGQPAPAPRRRLHPRRPGGIPPRPGRDGLYADTQTPLPPCAGGHRRHRSLAAAPDPLRLLGRHAPPLHPGRVGCRPADLRHGRKSDSGGGQGDAQRLQCQAAAQNPAGSLHGRRELCFAPRPGDNPPPAQLRSLLRRQTGIRRELHRHRDAEQPDGTRHDAGGADGQPLRGGDTAQRDADDRRTRPFVRPALRAGAPPALCRQRRHSGMGDD